MDIFYINLADQTERRRKLESNFQASNALQWSLHRVDAISSQTVANQVRGRLRDSEKACFQSHIKAIEMAKQSAGHVLIAEDDILFGSRSFRAIEDALALVPEDSWDIIFTDVCVTNTHAMIDLMLLRRRASGDAAFKLINLSRLPFAGATAYIVNGKSKDKILALLPNSGPLEIPMMFISSRSFTTASFAALSLSPLPPRYRPRRKIRRSSYPTVCRKAP